MIDWDKIERFFYSPKGRLFGWAAIFTFIGIMYYFANKAPKEQEIKRIFNTETQDAKSALDTIDVASYVAPDKEIAQQDSAKYSDFINTFVKKNYKPRRAIRKHEYFDEEDFRENFEKNQQLVDWRNKYRQSLIDLAIIRQQTKSK